MKLSEAQRRLLTILRDENTTIHTISGRSGTHAFISGRLGNGESWVRLVTIFKLEEAGLLENITEEGWRWRGSQYRITQAGKDTLA